MKLCRRLALLFLICASFVGVGLSKERKPEPVQVKIVTDEADAVLSALAKRVEGQSINDGDWQRIFSSEGYVRLKRREEAMRRQFGEEDFKTFVLSDQLLARLPALRETLARWKQADVNRSARLALRYLPEGAKIQAKIYLVIKPRENSFVFDLDNDPAIFLYLDPAVTRAKFENTLGHELHHIGYGTVCPTKETQASLSTLPKVKQAVLTYVRAFGEGFAMLAAAGGPDIHPHAVSEAKDRARWDSDVANFNSDLKKVEQFYLDALAEKLTQEQFSATAASFFGEQGAWYTVGWQMCVVIEKTLGRRALIDAMCDPRKLLVTYNRAASQYMRKTRKPLALWSQTLLDQLPQG